MRLRIREHDSLVTRCSIDRCRVVGTNNSSDACKSSAIRQTTTIGAQGIKICVLLYIYVDLQVDLYAGCLKNGDHDGRRGYTELCRYLSSILCVFVLIINDIKRE